MRIAIYIRVSTEAQMENYSIPLQLERLKGYCTSRGWNNVTEFIDGGFSGSNVDRPDLQKLIKNIKSYDAVVVYRLDRLSRSQKDTLHLIEDIFIANDVEFISVSESIDTTTPFGRAMIGILAVFAQLERETITERLQSGRYKMAKEEGLWQGGADTSPAGYTRLERGKLVVNESEMEIVERLFGEYLKVQSITKVIHKLKGEGVPIWRYRRCHDILRNRLYTGEVSFKGEWFKGAHEARISKCDFDKVQSLLDDNKGANTGKIKYMIFTDKLLCGCCGEKYRSYIANSKLADGTKTKYYYYTCSAKRTPAKFGYKCDNTTLKRDHIEDTIFKAIDNLTYQDFIKERKNKVVNYQPAIDKIDSKIRKTLDLYLNGNVDQTLLDEKLVALNNEKNELSRKKSEQEKESINKEILELLEGKEFKMNEMSLEEKRAIVNLLIKQIVYTYGSIHIIWN